jgi:acyl-CoA thioester hydrolase
MENAAAPRCSIEFRVRYAETDQMGVVYHANYLVWCEVGRTELIRRRGPSYAELEREGVLLAVAEANLRFHAPARYDDLVRVETWVEEVRSRTVTFGYLISRVDAGGGTDRLVSARTVLVALDADSRPRKLPADLVERLGDA